MAKKQIKKRLDELFDKDHYEEPKTGPRENEDETAGQEELEAVEAKAQDMEPTMDESESQTSELGTDDEENIIEDAESVEPLVDASEDDADLSPDDLLDEVRHSLIEVEEEKEEKTKWWQRFGKGSRKKKSEVEPVEVSELVDELEVSESLEEVDIQEEQDEYAEQIDELIEMLDTDDETPAEVVDVDTPVMVEDEQEKEEKAVVDLAEMKKRAFRTATPEEDEEISEVRSVALEGGDEVFVEIETRKEDQAEVRWKAFENALLPYRNYITFTAVFIGFLAVIAIGYLVYDRYQKSLPPPPIEEVESLPYPTVMYFPGGVFFNLGRGSLDNGRWDPVGPEWLAGTEICRWVAIPYSRQWEAVVRTLTRDDKIELLMSNGDRLSYDVYSITQMTLDEMLDLNANTPCLLVVLADAKSDERWVVTAKP